MRPSRSRSPRGVQGGFSLIEVLIAILVLGVGLLGFALMQTMNVRFVQSANYRTQATNLTYEMLDQLRVNRKMAPVYVGDYTATTSSKNCLPPTGKDISKDAFTLDWRCRLGKALGDGATGKVTRNGDQYSVSVSWGDERWNADAGDTTFTARSGM